MTKKDMKNKNEKSKKNIAMRRRTEEQVEKHEEKMRARRKRTRMRRKRVVRRRKKKIQE